MPTNKNSPNKRLLQGARSREEILDAAERMMSVRGYDGTSVADIARESGLPNSSIYWHFNSKAGIIAAVMERGAERFFARVAPRPVQPGDTPRAYLRRMLRHSSDAYAQHPEFWRLFVLLLLSNHNPDIATIIDRVRARGREALRGVLAAAYSGEGEQAAARVADALADFALASFDGAFLGIQASPAPATERIVDQLADSLVFLAGGMLAPPAGDAASGNG